MIYVKTHKGIEEITTRAHRLSLHERQALILFDGKRTQEEVMATLPADKSCEVFAKLNEGSFITLLVPVVPTVTVVDNVVAPQPITVVPAPEDDAQRFMMGKNFMLNTLNAFVGLSASSLMARVEESRTIPQLRDLYTEWHQSIGLSTDGRKRRSELESKLSALVS